MVKVLVIGDEMIDRYVHFEKVRDCSEGPWPIVAQTRVTEQPGGAGAVAAMCESLGAEVRLIGREAGHDVPVKTRYLIDGEIIARLDEEEIIVHNASILRQLESYPRAAIIPPDVVLVSDYAKGVINAYVMEYLRGWGVRVIADPHIFREPEFYRGCWAVTPNRAAWHDRKREWFGFPRLALKLDSEGLNCIDGPIDGGPFTRFPSIATQPPVDVTGAGDQVLATLGVMVAEGKPFLEACRIANIAAGLKCGKLGATPVTREELEAALEPVRA